MKYLVAIIFFLLLFVNSSFCATCTIYPGGSIQDSVTTYGNGTTFLLKTGIHRYPYAGGSNKIHITPAMGDTFLGEVGTILNGAEIITGWDRDTILNVWVVGDIEQFNTTSGTCKDGTLCTYPEDLWIDDQLIVRVADAASVVEGTFYLKYSADSMWLGTSPDGKTVELSTMRHAIYDSLGRDSVYVKGIQIEKYANNAQRGAIQSGQSGAYGYYWAVDSCVIQYNHGVGVKLYDYSRIRGNTIYFNGQLGISVEGQSCLIEGNIMSYNNYADFSFNWEAGGMKAWETNKAIIRNNYSHHNDGVGIWIDNDNDSCLITQNICEDNERDGIFYEISWNGDINHNTVRRNGFSKAQETWWGHGSGILIANSSYIKVHNNVVENNARNILWVNQNRLADTSAIYPTLMYFCRNIDVYNNLILANSVYDPHWFASDSLYSVVNMWTGGMRDYFGDSVFTTKGNIYHDNIYSATDSVRFAWNNAFPLWSTWKAYPAVKEINRPILWKLKRWYDKLTGNPEVYHPY